MCWPPLAPKNESWARLLSSTESVAAWTPSLRFFVAVPQAAQQRQDGQAARCWQQRVVQQLIDKAGLFDGRRCWCRRGLGGRGRSRCRRCRVAGSRSRRGRGGCWGGRCCRCSRCRRGCSRGRSRRRGSRRCSRSGRARSRDSRRTGGLAVCGRSSGCPGGGRACSGLLELVELLDILVQLGGALLGGIGLLGTGNARFCGLGALGSFLAELELVRCYALGLLVVDRGFHLAAGGTGIGGDLGRCCLGGELAAVAVEIAALCGHHLACLAWRDGAGLFGRWHRQGYAGLHAVDVAANKGMRVALDHRNQHLVQRDIGGLVLGRNAA